MAAESGRLFFHVSRNSDNEALQASVDNKLNTKDIVYDRVMTFVNFCYFKGSHVLNYFSFMDHRVKFCPLSRKE